MSEHEEIQLRQAVENGARINEILADPVYQKAVADTEKRLFDEWRQSAPEDTAKREGAFYALKALDRVQEMLRTVVNAGAHASHNLRLKGKR